MLSDMSNSTAELSVASHQVLELKGVSSSQPYTDFQVCACPRQQ